MTNILISPLGRSPGAVSGVYFALQARDVDITKVVTVGTSHPDVIAASRNYLARLFNHLGVIYDPIHLPEQELRNERRSVMPYAGMMGLVTQNAKNEGAEAHVAVTGGRSGMGALAALAAQFYGAVKLWHLWVPAEIEQGGTVDQLRGLVSPQDMLESPYINPTKWGDKAWDLVDLPFMDLSHLLPALREYQQSGKQPDLNSALLQILSKTGIKRLSEIFPAGMTIEQAEEYLGLVKKYRQAPNQAEREAEILEIGMLLQRTGIVSAEDRQKLLELLKANASIDELLRLVQNDRTGFWAWLRAHKDEVISFTALSELVLHALELWLKTGGVIS